MLITYLRCPQLQSSQVGGDYGDRIRKPRKTYHESSVTLFRQNLGVST